MFKHENSTLIELENFSPKDKLLFSESYKYDENNFIKEIFVKEPKNIKDEVFVYEYKYDDIGNITEEKLYQKIGVKLKKIICSKKIKYVYYE